MKPSAVAIILVLPAISLAGTIAYTTDISNSTTTTRSVLRQEEEFGGGNEVAGNALRGVAVLLSTFFQIVQDLSKLNATSTPLGQVLSSSLPSAMMQSAQKNNEIVTAQSKPPQKMSVTEVTALPVSEIRSTLPPSTSPPLKTVNNLGPGSDDEDDNMDTFTGSLNVSSIFSENFLQ